MNNRCTNNGLVFFALVLILLFVKAQYAKSQHVVYASDYGVRAKSFQNASAAIRATIEACKGKSDVVLRFPEGRIDLWTDGAFKKELYISNSTENDTLSKERNIAMLIEDMENITIEGSNTTFVLHGKIVPFVLINSKNVKLKGLNFDYERPTMSELRLLSVSDTLIRARIHRDSRYFIDKGGQIVFYGDAWKCNNFHTIKFSPQSETMTYSSFNPFLQAYAKDEGCQELAFRGRFNTADYNEGEVLTVRDPYRDNVGGFINQSKDIELNAINIHYMHGMGIISQFSENVSFINIEVAPTPSSGRLIASFADCFHFSGCKGQILLEACHTSGTHDDPVNVHGTHLKITSIKDNKMRVRFMHHQTYGFKAFFAGDSVAFTNPETLLNQSFGKIKSSRMINKRELEIELEGALPSSARVGGCLENITYCPDVTIRDCHFERTNTRGVLMTTRGKVLIENNMFYHTGMHAILIADDANNWFESGPVRDVTIRNNKFVGCAYNQPPASYVIAISPENKKNVPNKTVHSNIRIENNTFELISSGVLTAKSVSNLVFENNKIAFLKEVQSPAIIDLNACEKVSVLNNTMKGEAGLDLIMQNIYKNEVKSDIK
ncbi:MAG: right-handed parallel beta-helix repeat-containing protein [Bacteroidales bacterium]